MTHRAAEKPDNLPAEPGEAGPLTVLPETAAAHVAPRCPHFGLCGGCQLQHLSPDAQLAQKQAALLELLAGLPHPPLQTHSADPWLYRNRIRLRVEPADDSPSPTLAVGYNLHQTNHFLPIHTCPIAAPALLRSALLLRDLAAADAVVHTWLHACAQIELFTTPDETALQLQLLLRELPRSPAGQPLPTSQLAASFRSLFQSLLEQMPQLTGIGAEAVPTPRANKTTPRRDRALANLPELAAGRTGLQYPVPLSPAADQATPLWVSRSSFFQVNRSLLPTLLHTALAGANLPAPPARLALAWDLFAGVGLFARALAPSFRRVVAVESAPSAVADLRSARVSNIELVPSTVLDFLRGAAIARDRPSLVLLDPPRAGLGEEATALLCRVRPPRVVYVSCDPATLARDLRTMLSSRYVLAELHLLDMFPQTAHLETVAVLTRQDD